MKGGNTPWKERGVWHYPVGGTWGLRDEAAARFYCLVVERFGEGTVGSAQVVNTHMGRFETVTACSDRS